MKVTLFTKVECGLCREAETMLQRLRQKLPLELEVVDIEGDPALYNSYWDRVPVVVVEGREVAAAPLDEALLWKALST